MRIKKSKDRNEYINADGIWVRNFNNKGVPHIDINKMFSEKEYQKLLKNEISNRSRNLQNIDEEEIWFNKIIIVSDGYDFENKSKMLRKIPQDVAVIATNGALAKWNLHLGEDPKPINLYIVNNPYSECTKYLPSLTRYYPVCVSSIRTCPEFLDNYHGQAYFYEPSQQKDFGSPYSAKYHIDDYRNPICAAIGIAAQFKTKKLMLFCCDDSFENERSAAEKLPNGLWTYPQQLKSQKIIDANLFWYKQREDVEIADHSSCAEYSNAQYIEKETEIISFFEDTQE